MDAQNTVYYLNKRTGTVTVEKPEGYDPPENVRSSGGGGGGGGRGGGGGVVVVVAVVVVVLVAVVVVVVVVVVATSHLIPLPPPPIRPLPPFSFQVLESSHKEIQRRRSSIPELPSAIEANLGKSSR